jgi:outer membrane protein assembly factor BamE (lipoprotein component of BamABCDE complex)
MKFKLQLPALMQGCAILLAASQLSACTPAVAERGNLVDPDRLAQIKIGSSKDDVVKAIGSPTSIGAFDTNYWYYMGQRTEQESFFDPVVTDRRIVEIQFNDNDKVTSLKEYGKDNAEIVDMEEDSTPVMGHQTTFAEELFGNGGLGSDKNKKKKSD